MTHCTMTHCDTTDKLLYLARQWRSAMEAHSAAAREARAWELEFERMRLRAEAAEAALATALVTIVARVDGSQ